jgi:hypothetical protein
MLKDREPCGIKGEFVFAHRADCMKEVVKDNRGDRQPFQDGCVFLIQIPKQEVRARAVMQRGDCAAGRRCQLAQSHLRLLSPLFLKFLNQLEQEARTTVNPQKNSIAAKVRKENVTLVCMKRLGIRFKYSPTPRLFVLALVFDELVRVTDQGLANPGHFKTVCPAANGLR